MAFHVVGRRQVDEQLDPELGQSLPSIISCGVLLPLLQLLMVQLNTRGGDKEGWAGAMAPLMLV